MIRASLRSFDLFEDFRDWEIDRLRGMMKMLRLPAGTVFIREGALADTSDAQAFITVAGTVRVARKGGKGEFATDAELGPGNFLGVVALVLDHARTATCTTGTDAQLLAIDRATFDRMFESDSRLAVKFKHVVARQLARDLRRTNAALAHKAAGGE